MVGTVGQLHLLVMVLLHRKKVLEKDEVQVKKEKGEMEDLLLREVGDPLVEEGELSSSFLESLSQSAL